MSTAVTGSTRVATTAVPLDVVRSPVYRRAYATVMVTTPRWAMSRHDTASAEISASPRADRPAVAPPGRHGASLSALPEAESAATAAHSGPSQPQACAEISEMDT